jgi:RNA polymerase sigma-70 factor, ECF subfamily
MPRMKTNLSTAPRADAPDAELAGRVARGDTAAFETLMRRHNRMLFRTARAILRDDAEAEDALQEAYLHAYEAMGTWRSDAKLSTWIARIVANEALMRLRKQTRRAAIVPLQPGAALDPIVDPT